MEVKELAELTSLLRDELNTDNGSVLAQQLSAAEAWSSRVAGLAVEAKSILRTMRNKYLLPKSKDLTELDRTTRLDASCADFEARANYLADLQDIIQRRIILGQSILKSIRTEIESL